MTPEELRKYKMTSSEKQKWYEVTNSIREYCDGIVPKEYTGKIEYHISEKPYDHYVGFCEAEGYYYVAEGDRGELEVLWKSFEKDKIQIYLMKNILRDVGQSMELKNRDTYKDTYKYHVRYDSRKWWFEYMLNGLVKVFGLEKVNHIIDDYTESMNHWFHEKHWDFDREKLMFVEISDALEYDKEELINLKIQKR